ncbi:MAG: hypothetical protein V3R99_01015 [Thermoguttaceae bacterium]
MTSRERWVVYPLLFLTLGMTMRDKVWPQRHFMANDMTAFGEITAGKITCNQLEVGQAECRLMTLTGRNGRDAIRLGAAPNGTGRLELLATDGSVLVTLGGEEAGGVVAAIGRDQDIQLVLGHYDDQYGVFAQSAKVGRRVPLTLPWQFETSLPKKVPVDGPDEEERPDDLRTTTEGTEDTETKP